MDSRRKSEIGIRLLKYLKDSGYEVQVVGRTRNRCQRTPSVCVYKLTGDWTRGFQEKTEIFSYTSDRYEITHEKFMAAFAEWYCLPGMVETLRLIGISSGGRISLPVSSSPEELSLFLAVRGH